MKPNYQIDDTVWLECLTGYKLANQKLSSVTCGKDTLWSTPGPTCLGKGRVFFLQETMLCEFQELTNQTAKSQRGVNRAAMAPG